MNGRLKDEPDSMGLRKWMILAAALIGVVTTGACQPAQDNIVIPTLMVLPSLTPTATETLAPSLTPMNAPTLEPTATELPPTATLILATATVLILPTAETTLDSAMDGGAAGADEIPSASATTTLTNTATRTRTPTLTRTGTATRTQTATMTRTRTQTPTATTTRTPFPTVMLPATITHTPVSTIFTSETGGDEATLASGGGMIVPTMPVSVPAGTFVGTRPPSLTPTPTFTRTPTSNVPPTVGGGQNLTPSTPIGGAPGESDPPPGVTGQPLNTPVAGDPPIVTNPSPTPINPGGVPVDPPAGA